MILTKGGFSILRASFGALSQGQVDAINHIVSEIDKDESISYPQAAYILATTWHETGKTMQPIKEYGLGKGRLYGTWFKNSKGELYAFKNHKKRDAYLFSEYCDLFYGRGFVQLTWFDNYAKASKKIGHDFLNFPDDVMKLEFATKILIIGMRDGWFTGKRLDQYIHGALKDYEGARRIINGTDRAKKIASEALIFEKALRSL